jgi:hypothetical protein
MSDRIAHRPRYRSMRQLIQPSLRSHQSFFRNRWAYRRHEATYEKRPLGYGLSLIPVAYRLVPTLFLRRT